MKEYIVVYTDTNGKQQAKSTIAISEAQAIYQIENSYSVAVMHGATEPHKQ